MQTIYLNSKSLLKWQRKANPSVMALGFFDGVHKGHLEVIETAARKAKEKNLAFTVMSFFPHPRTVLSGQKDCMHYLMSNSDKAQVFHSLGVDTFYIVEFDKAFASLSPEQFVTDYVTGLRVVHAVAGFDFSYGHLGEGHMNRLKSDSGGLLGVTKVPKVEFHGEKVSSTCIRDKLLKGHVEKLPELLGRFYEVECEWNGEFLKLNRGYTMPAPGRYAVVIKQGNRWQQGEVFVTEESDHIGLRNVMKTKPHVGGKVSILWKRRIHEVAMVPGIKNKVVSPLLLGAD